MRKQKTWACWVWLSVVFVLAAATLVAAFVPMQFSKGTYHSFFGAQTYSADLSDKMVVTYTYKTSREGTSEDVSSACKKIESILRENGHVSATAVALGSNKIEVTLAKPEKGDQLQNAIALLGSQGIGVGGFELKTKNTADAEALLIGSKHVKSVKTISNSGYYYTVVEFTKEGKSLLSSFEALAAEKGESVNYYLYFGGSSEITGGYAFTPSQNFVDGALYIGGFESAEVADQYELLMNASTLKVTLNSASIRDIVYQENKTADTARVVYWVFVLAVIVAFLVLVGVRHGVFAFVASFVSNIFVAGLVLLLSVAMPWVEMSVASLVTIAIGFAVLNTSILAMFERMKRENKMGKDFEMSVDSGYQKSIFQTLATSLVMFVAGLVVALVFGGTVRVVATVVAMFGVLSSLATLCCTKAVFNWLSIALPRNKHTIAWEENK